MLNFFRNFQGIKNKQPKDLLCLAKASRKCIWILCLFDPLSRCKWATFPRVCSVHSEFLIIKGDQSTRIKSYNFYRRLKVEKIYSGRKFTKCLKKILNRFKISDSGDWMVWYLSQKKYVGINSRINCNSRYRQHYSLLLLDNASPLSL